MFRISSSRLLFAASSLFLSGLPKAGKVTNWKDLKGFGFITGLEDSKQDCVHFGELQVVEGGYKSLVAGQEVEFVAEEAEGKRKALKVTGPGGSLLAGGPRPNPKKQGIPLDEQTPASSASDDKSSEAGQVNREQQT